jgi:hypothetical protein
VSIPTFGPPECQQRNPAIDPRQYEWRMYGDSACKLLSISPSGEYLAYVILTPLEDGEVGYGVEVVKLMRRGTTEGYSIYEVEPYYPVFYLQWSASNQLVFGGGYEGGQTVVYDPAGMKVLAKLAGPMEGFLFSWNPRHTAYYYNLEGGYGAEVCTSALYGFDFATGQEFPDVHELLGVEDEYDNPRAAINDLSFRVVGWSQDGQRLYLTVTPLKWIEDAFTYEIGPRRAAVIELADDGPVYREVQAAPDTDFFYLFDGQDFDLASQPYQMQLCDLDGAQ